MTTIGGGEAEYLPPGPVEMVGQEEDLSGELLRPRYSKGKKLLMSRVALKGVPQD